jgi:hypothetical protein
MTRDPNDWTPAVGWKNVGIHMLIRGAVASGILLGVIALLAEWWRSSEGTLPTGLILWAAYFVTAFIMAGVLTHRLVDATSIVSKALMLVVVVVLALAALTARGILNQTSLGIYAGDTCFIFPAVIAAVVGSLFILKEV